MVWRNRRAWRIWQSSILLLAIMSAAQVLGQEADAPPYQPPLPPALRVYEGRVIAQTMHYLGAEWLVRDNREQE